MDESGCSCNIILGHVCNYHLLLAGVPFELNPETLEVTFPGYEKKDGP